MTLSQNTTRIAMYVVALIIGVIALIVGFTTNDPNTKAGFIGLGAAIVLNAIYAWIRGLGPSRDPVNRPGWEFEMWPDGVVILAIGAVCFVLAFLIF